MMHEMSKAGQPFGEPTAAERRHAIRAVAGRAHDASDLAELLNMLGLDPSEGRSAEQSPSVPTQHSGHQLALGKTPTTRTSPVRRRTKTGAQPPR